MSQAERSSSPLPRRALTSVAIGGWLLLSLLHGQGSVIVASWFRSFGRVAVESGFVATIAFLALAMPLVFRLFRPARAPGEWLLALAGVLAATFAVERLFLILYSELFHLPQYAALGLLLGSAWGRQPALLVLGLLLGMGDEGLQLLMLYLDDPGGHFDWNDVLLDLVGFALGLLAGELFERAPPPKASSDHGLLAACVGVWLLAMMLQLQEGFADSEFWTVWSFDGRPRVFHELSFYAGMATCAAAVPLLNALLAWDQVAGRRLRLGAFLLLAALPTAFAWQFAPKPETPPLPSLWVVKASAPPILDGELDDELWRHAQAALVETNRRGETQGPTSRVFVAWDEVALYFAFECPDDDVWTRRRPHDDPHLPEDEVVELFLLLQTRGEQSRYLELEISPEGQTYELMVQHEGEDFTGDPSFELPGFRLSTKVQGRLRSFDEAPGGSQGWTAELAIPWTALPGLTPDAGRTLRANLFRVERPANSDPALLCWSTTMDASFHKPARFGRLRLSAKAGKARPQR